MVLQKGEEHEYRGRCPFPVMSRAGKIPRSWTLPHWGTQTPALNQCLIDSDSKESDLLPNVHRITLRRALPFRKGTR